MNRDSNRRHVRIIESMAVAGMRDGFVDDIEGGDIFVALIDPSDEIIIAHRYLNEVEFVDRRPDCKGSIALGSGCRECDSCYEQAKAGITRQPTETPSKPRKMKPIPIAAAERIAREYGYDQVVIMARRVSQPLPPINPYTARPDDGINGEHITTYGIDKVHCDIAALMGNILKDIARWPEKEDFDKARELLEDLDDGVFDYTDYDGTVERIAALSRILVRKA